jgi:hypothetical protein
VDILFKKPLPLLTLIKDPRNVLFIGVTPGDQLLSCFGVAKLEKILG